ncbi:MAG: PQQ-binding-like beta-propeller repeat protein [Phycisphaerales bacterium]|nr:PQQ-binding-like beta-propeller repeat protein [Phycisphaerales bacterium]
MPRRLFRSVGLALLLAALTPALPDAHARQPGPVFPDDSLAAREALTRVEELSAAGNLGEAVRVLQQTIEREGERVLEAPGRPDLFIPVRARAHDLLLSTPALLDRYRAAEGPRADALLATPAGVESVERSRLLTPAGLEAALRLAQEHLESARFEAARLTLAQLDRHPDRLAASPASRDAARLAEQVALRLHRPEVTAWASAWLKEAGVEPAAPAADSHPPAPLLLSPFTPTTAFAPDQVVGRPLATAWLSPELAASAENARRRRGRGRAIGEDISEQPWVMPTCAGDVLYINDSFGVSAWDRLTLTPIWRNRPLEAGLEPGAEPDPDLDRTVLDYGNTRNLEDSAQVAVASGIAVAATGWVRDGERHGDPRIHAFDAATGRTLWSVALASIDPSLTEGGARGSILIDQDTVVLAVRRVAGNRRVTSSHLAAVDLYTGRPRWARLLATAGSLPYQRMSRVTDTPLLRHGLVYRVDDVGIIAAVESVTGRTVWVRRFKGLNTANAETTAPWASSAPIISGDSLIALSPSHDAVVRLDPATGDLLGQRAAGELDDPRYILAAGPWLACIGETHITLADAATFETAPPARSAEFMEPPICGRTIIADGRLLIPVGPGPAAGLLLLDPAAPAEPRRVSLETSGNVLAVGSDVLIVDDARLHSYVGWERADRVLSARLDADPADARPALSLVDLAYRAGKTGRIAAAADIALDRLGRPAARPSDADESRRLQRQLYTSLLGMLQTAQYPPAPDAAPSPTAIRDPIIRDPAVLDALTDRLGRAAESADEQVTYLLTLGRLREMQSNAPAAIDAYQRVLTRPELASGLWNSAQLTVRGDLEAARRIREVIARFGRAPYQAFDQEVQRESIAAGENPAALEELARAYPAAASGPSIWIRAAELHDRAGRAGDAARAYAAALSASEWALQLGERDRFTEIGEITGRLVGTLEAQDRLSAAAQLLHRIQTAYPQAQITRQGAPLAADSLSAGIALRLSTLERPARVGPRILREPQRLDGWELLPALTHDRPQPVEHVVMISPSTSRIGLWSAGIESGKLQLSWTRDTPAVPPVLIRLDAQAAYFYWPAQQGGVVEKIQIVGGQTAWTSQPIRGLLGRNRDPLADGGPVTLPTPLDGEVRPGDLLVATDEQTLLLVERGGGATALDLATGRALWSRAASLAIVHDADINAGFVALAGIADAHALENISPAPRIVILDARTGESLRTLPALPGSPRWIRLTPQGLLLSALEDRVAAWDASTGSVQWTMTDPGARRCLDCWAFGDRLFLLDADRQLWLASLASGRSIAGPLKGRERLGERLSITASAAGPNVAFATERGFLIYNPAGELIGADGADGRTGLIPARAAESLLVCIQSERTELPDGRSAARLMLFAPDSGKLLRGEDIILTEDPSEMALLDGAVVITAGSSTIVLAAPVER